MAVDNEMPFYVDSGGEAYVRNKHFLQQHCELFPALNVNTGILGFSPQEFADLPFIEYALHKLINVPDSLAESSMGYRDPDQPGNSTEICWWVMEQTVYALLLGRNKQLIALDRMPIGNQVAHPFSTEPIRETTALQHFISDNWKNNFFPLGVEYLIKNGFLENEGTKPVRDSIV
jgi:hypothetical protein